jgi:hypothetical protein
MLELVVVGLVAAMVEILVVVEGAEIEVLVHATHVAKRVTSPVSAPKVDSMDLVVLEVLEVVAMEGAMVVLMVGVVMGAVLMMMVLSMVPVKVVAMAAVATMTAVATHLVLVEEVIIGRGKNGNLYGRLGAVGENSGCQFLDTSVYCEIILQFHFIARGGLEGFCRKGGFTCGREFLPLCLSFLLISFPFVP